MSYYDYEEFRLACSKGVQKVIVSKNSENGAERDFGLAPKEKILRFIYNRGLEELKFIRFKEWENNSGPEIVYVDSYEFRSSSKLGYIAFLKTISKFNNKEIWILKSFKLSDNNSDLALTLIEAGIPDLIKE